MFRNLGAPALTWRPGPTEEAEDAASGSSDGSPQTFVELLEDVRRRYGDKVAFQQKTRGAWERMSHIEVHARSLERAAGLVALGVEQGDRVALIAENSIDWVCSYYAIVVSGAIAVPLYYELKPDEVGAMIDQAEPKAAFVSARFLGKFSAQVEKLQTVIAIGAAESDNVPAQFQRRGGPQLVHLGDLPGRSSVESRAKLCAIKVKPDDLASIVFTSGTTGGMKGVMLTHGNFMANMKSVRRSIPFNGRDRLMMVLPMHHAFPFTVGVVVAPAVGGEVTFENDLRRIRDRMRELKPTLFLGVPQLFELMYRNIVHGIEAQGRLENFERGLRIVEATKQRTGINIGRIVFRELHKRLGGSLRFMVSGGAALNPQIARNFASLGILIVQGWGLTESAPVLSVQRWNPRRFYMSNYYEDQFGTVGQALDGIEVAMIDVPEKEIYVHLHHEGELIARGANITPGYWRSEEATKSAKVGEWLRTGDVGYLDDEGNIWITGRSKFVIVLDSGEKVHPDEIEAKIERSAVVEDVALIGRKHRGKTQAWAIIYPNRDEVLARLDGAAPTEQAVRAIVKAEIDAQQQDMAVYKRPTDFMLTDIPLPRTIPLRKIARGQIADSYSFDPRRWEQSWAELQAAAAQPPSSEEGEEAGVVA